MKLAECLIKLFQMLAGLYSSKLFDSAERGFFGRVEAPPNLKILGNSECGVSSVNRIIGGKIAELGQYPWMAQIGYLIKGKIGYRCGGAIISEYYVLTAAHCVHNLEVPIRNIKVGEYDARTDIDCQDGQCAPPSQKMDIKEIIIHPDYGVKTHKNDIAIIRLRTPILYNDYVSPICLPYGRLMDEDYEGKIGEVAGWGKFNNSAEKLSPKLLYVKIKIVPLKTCKSKFPGYGIGKGQLCAGGIQNKDSCGGDSGGPLMIPESLDSTAPRYFLAGLVSFGAAECGASQVPAIYTDVRTYMNFILRNLRP